ncbi:MAG: hypothetical protein HQ565_02560 [Bacteroidetes bacterium]|nr:hypothetical protein [Bacteroidota bacterium]
MPFTLGQEQINMQGNYNILIEKLHSFIRKYYINQMLRGGIYFIAVFALFFLFINVFEYYSWSSTLVRTTIFYVYLAINLLILFRLVVIPLLKLFRIGRVMRDEEAATIIGNHFPEVSDKLTNTIQLKKLSEGNGSIALLNASIEQKTKTLHPVPFVRAVDFSKNKKYLKYAIPPMLVILIVLIASPSTITEPSKRLINHREQFTRPLPFEIHILNDKLEAIQQEDFTLRIAVKGDEHPAALFISMDNSMLPFQKGEGSIFTYTLNNLQQDLQFKIIAEEYIFGPYSLRVLPKPIIINYQVSLDYPAYTGKKDEDFENTGDFVVPEGTDILWKVLCRDTRTLSFVFPEKNIILEMQGSNAFLHHEKLLKSISYSISTSNEYLSNPDTLSYAITVIPDTYPIAIFEEFRDSVYEKRLYFRGQIIDDYGFSALTFNYEFLNHFDSVHIEGKIFRAPVLFSPDVSKQMVFHHFDIGSLDVGPGDDISYYFEVWDNDEVNGFKSSRSHKMIFRAPTAEEITAQNETANQEIKDEMEDIVNDARLLQLQIEKLNKQLINKKSLNWQDKEQIRDLLDQQQQLQERMEMLQQQNQEKNAREQEYKNINEDILQKQQQLQELFDEVMTDEMKALFEELQKMLDEISKDDVSEMLEKMEMSASELEEELDKSLELFKQLEFDKKLSETIEKLNNLAEKQQELSKQSADRKADKEKLSEQQQKLNDEFQEVREDLDEIERLNDELDDPHRLEETDEQENSIQQQQDNSLEQLQKSKQKSAGESQKKAAGEMKELAEILFNMQMMMELESTAEDIRVLREILENLLVISFAQEELISDLNSTNITDPRYQEIIQRQHEIKDNMKIVEDSLYALSRRQLMIEPFITGEVDKINKNITDANSWLEDRKKGRASSSQQYVMTSVNNLALLLSEALLKMQQMQNINMQGNSSCKNPGGSSPGKMPQTMSEMQKQLNDQMKQMKDGQKQEGTEGQKGQKSQNGKKSMSEQFARMAAQQEALRQQMQQYLEQLKSMGETGDAGLNKLMEDMGKTELDLVNKRLTEETMLRQEEIFSRLLKHEKAVREREKEERRESREAKSQDYSNPKEFLEYKRLLSKEVELLKTVPPNLKPYYKRKVNEYFYNFGN